VQKKKTGMRGGTKKGRSGGGARGGSGSTQERGKNQASGQMKRIIEKKGCEPNYTKRKRTNRWN